jgi:hypothetical protein
VLYQTGQDSLYTVAVQERMSIRIGTYSLRIPPLVWGFQARRSTVDTIRMNRPQVLNTYQPGHSCRRAFFNRLHTVSQPL